MRMVQERAVPSNHCRFSKVPFFALHSMKLPISCSLYRQSVAVYVFMFDRYLWGICGQSAVSCRCARCKQADYCSDLCQQTSWRNGHRAICQPFGSRAGLLSVVNPARQLNFIICRGVYVCSLRNGIFLTVHVRIKGHAVSHARAHTFEHP